MSDASVSAGVPRRELRIDRVLGRAFSLLGSKLPRYFLLAALPGVPNLLASLLQGDAQRFTPGALPPWLQGLNFSSSGTIATIILVALAIIAVVVFVFTLVYVSMIYGVLQDMRGQSFRLWDGVRRGLNRFWPLIGLWICIGLAIIGIGMGVWIVTLIFVFVFTAIRIPALSILIGILAVIVIFAFAVILITRWWVAVPCCVIENDGPILSLGRSSTLTQGNRWRVFAILLVIGAGTVIPALIFAGVFTLMGLPRLAAVVGFVWNAFATAYHLIATVVTYYELRLVREGADVNSIASVFD